MGPDPSTEAAVSLLLNLATPPGSDRPSAVSWVRRFDENPDLFRAALDRVPGIRHDGGRLWRLGDPGDPWVLTLLVLGQNLVATAPQGWAGGTNPGECQVLYREWMDTWVGALTFPSTP